MSTRATGPSACIGGADTHLRDLEFLADRDTKGRFAFDHDFFNRMRERVCDSRRSGRRPEPGHVRDWSRGRRQGRRGISLPGRQRFFASLFFLLRHIHALSTRSCNLLIRAVFLPHASECNHQRFCGLDVQLMRLVMLATVRSRLSLRFL